MRTLLILHFAWVTFAATADGANYETNFDTFSRPGQVAGVDGWTINDETPGLSFIATRDGSVPDSNAAGLGGFFDAPTSSTVELKHAYGGSLGTTQVSFLFTIFDSTAGFPDRDMFGFSLMSAGNNLFTVYFTPVTQTPDPEADPNAQWNLSYVAGAEPAVSLTQGVLEGGNYAFNLTFTPRGSSTDFSLRVTADNTAVRTGTVLVDPNSIVTDFGMLWTPSSGPASSGDNYFVLDNLALAARTAIQPPPLSITNSGSGLVISWPSSEEVFALDFASVLGSGTWRAVTNPPTVSGGRTSVSIVATEAAQFFRLRGP